MKTFFGKVLLFVIVISLFTISTGFASGFSDVTTEHKNYDAILSMSEKKIVNGYDDGTFKPDNSVTRAELCVIIARTAGYIKNSGNYINELPFSDVKNGYWAEDYIKFAYKNGIVNGMGDGTFLPAGGVTYEQAVKMVICFVGLEKEALKIKGSKWYTGYLEVAHDRGILKNVQIIVADKATRSDIVQLIYNAYENDLIAHNDQDDAKVEDDNIENNKDNVEKEEERVVVHKEIKRILIDAGHNYSGFDIGARDEDEMIKEEVITWQISDKLYGILENDGFEVFITRKKKTSNIGNTSVLDSLQARVDMANELDVDLFISIHCNMGGGTGVETYCFEKESVGGVISEMISESISDSTGLYDRGAKTADYYVIKNTIMPSVLVETGFIDSEVDAKILTSMSGRAKIANAISDAIKEYNKVYKKFNNKNTEGKTYIND